MVNLKCKSFQIKLCAYLQMATVLFYLTDVEEGGETVFPFEGINGLERKPTFNYKDCTQGFRVSTNSIIQSVLSKIYGDHFQMRIEE